MSDSVDGLKMQLARLQEENARLRKSIEELSMLNDLSRIISSTLALDRIMDKVVSASVKAIGAEQGTVHLLQQTESTDPFRTFVRKGDQATPEWKYRLDDVLSGWMLKHRKPLLINDFEREPLVKSSRAMSTHIRSVLSMPLICKGKMIGMLNLFNKKAGEGFTKDDLRLLSIIAGQSAQAIENARLYEEEKLLRAFEKELEMARAIQDHLLPKGSPQIKGFDVAGASYPAREVGGDYFDFIELGQDRLAIALGDVSGKGIPAAMLMANLQAVLRSQCLASSCCLDCIRSTNRILHLNTEANKFVTLFFGILDVESRDFKYINAGHNPPLYFTHREELIPLEKGGTVMGMLPDIPFEEGKLTLQPGETIVIYSDGVTEAENADGVMFGEERLRQAIGEGHTSAASQLIEKITQRVQSFAGEKPRDDDITLVVVKAT